MLHYEGQGYLQQGYEKQLQGNTLQHKDHNDIQAHKSIGDTISSVRSALKGVFGKAKNILTKEYHIPGSTAANTMLRNVFQKSTPHASAPVVSTTTEHHTPLYTVNTFDSNGNHVLERTFEKDGDHITIASSAQSYTEALPTNTPQTTKDKTLDLSPKDAVLTTILYNHLEGSYLHKAPQTGDLHPSHTADTDTSIISFRKTNIKELTTNIMSSVCEHFPQKSYNDLFNQCDRLLDNIIIHSEIPRLAKGNPTIEQQLFNSYNANPLPKLTTLTEEEKEFTSLANLKQLRTNLRHMLAKGNKQLISIARTS